MPPAPPSLVTIRRVPEGYFVNVEPPLPDGEDRRRTFGSKCAAFSYAGGIWSEHRLGACDMTENIGSANHQTKIIAE